MSSSSQDSTARFRRMRFIATAALAAVFVGMIIFRLLEPSVPWMGFLRAFCEAATVGALADWFAVTALFRHPMGIPLPHTAILPNNRERVAEALAQFIETNFLTEEQLGPEFRKMNYAALISGWLVENADTLSQKAADYAPKIISGFPDDEMCALLTKQARKMVLGKQLGPMMGEGLSIVGQNGRDREIYLLLLRSAEGLIVSNREMIKSKIREEIPVPVETLRNLPGLGSLGLALDQLGDSIAATVAAKTIEKIQVVLAEAESEPEHVLWTVFQSRFHSLIEDLKSSPEMAGRIHHIQRAVASSGAVDDFAARTWEDLKALLLRDCNSEDSVVRAKLRDAVISLAHQLGEDDANINAFLGEQVVKTLLAARPRARSLVISTIMKWDAESMAGRLESTFGPDLQFIRLNGTIIGGLAGLTIHLGFFLFGKG